MRITADTNILLRIITRDDEQQSQVALAEIANATLVAVPTATLCETVWVLAKGYKYSSAEIAFSVRQLLDTEKFLVDQQVSKAGLALLESGGDFADGAIEYEGNRMGGETFVSFDRKAVRLLTAQGKAARLAA